MRVFLDGERIRGHGVRAILDRVVVGLAIEMFVAQVEGDRIGGRYSGTRHEPRHIAAAAGIAAARPDVLGEAAAFVVDAGNSASRTCRPTAR